jgi:hypothetical protein
MGSEKLLYRGRFEMSGWKRLFQLDFTAAAGHRKMPTAYPIIIRLPWQASKSWPVFWFKEEVSLSAYFQ